MTAEAVGRLVISTGQARQLAFGHTYACTVGSKSIGTDSTEVVVAFLAAIRARLAFSIDELEPFGASSALCDVVRVAVGTAERATSAFASIATGSDEGESFFAGDACVGIRAVEAVLGAAIALGGSEELPRGTSAALSSRAAAGDASARARVAGFGGCVQERASNTGLTDGSISRAAGEAPRRAGPTGSGVGIKNVSGETALTIAIRASWRAELHLTILHFSYKRRVVLSIQRCLLSVDLRACYNSILGSRRSFQSLGEEEILPVGVGVDQRSLPLNICGEGQVVDKGLDWNRVLGKENHKFLRRMRCVGSTVELPYVNERLAHIDESLSRISNGSDRERDVSKSLLGVVDEVGVCFLDRVSGVGGDGRSQDQDLGEVRRELDEGRGLVVVEGVVEAVSRGVGSSRESKYPSTGGILRPK